MKRLLCLILGHRRKLYDSQGWEWTTPMCRRCGEVRP